MTLFAARNVVNVLAIVCCASALAARAQAQRDDDFHLSFQGSYLYGPADGFIQTPSGGQPGTTSRHRPHFGEIGINDANIGDVQLNLDWPSDRIFVGGQFISLSGNNESLQNTLVSQAETFPAGTGVRSDVRLDWYRVGYRHAFRFGND